MIFLVYFSFINCMKMNTPLSFGFGSTVMVSADTCFDTDAVSGLTSAISQTSTVVLIVFTA